MKKSKRGLVVFGIVFLVGIGYFMPTIVMHIKDWSLMNEEMEVEIESIQLESQNADMMETMDAFSEMLSNHFIVEVGDEFEISQEEAMKDDAIPNALFCATQEFLTILDPKEEVEFIDFSAQNYVMMAAKNEEKMYSVWVCTGKDRSGRAYYFWMDASLNKVMAFDVPFLIFGKDAATDYALFDAGMERVINYYDFASYGSPISSYVSDMEKTFKSKYWKNEMEILDKDWNIMLSLELYRNGDRFLFNVAPEYTIETYDAQSTR